MEKREIPKFIMDNDLPCLNYIKGIPGKFGFDLFLKNYVAVYMKLGMDPKELSVRCSNKFTSLYCERASADDNIKLLNLTDLDRGMANKIRDFFSASKNPYLSGSASKDAAYSWVNRILQKESPYSCCKDYYKSFNPDAGCCRLCPLSATFANHSIRSEYLLLRACVSSREVFDRASTAIGAKDFFAVYDIAQNDKSHAKPLLVSHTKILWKFLTDPANSASIFEMSSVRERTSALEDMMKKLLLEKGGAKVPNGLSGTVSIMMMEVFGADGDVLFNSAEDLNGVVDSFVRNVESRKENSNPVTNDGVAYFVPQSSPDASKKWSVVKPGGSGRENEKPSEVGTVKIEATELPKENSAEPAPHDDEKDLEKTTTGDASSAQGVSDGENAASSVDAPPNDLAGPEVKRDGLDDSKPEDPATAPDQNMADSDNAAGVSDDGAAETKSEGSPSSEEALAADQNTRDVSGNNEDEKSAEGLEKVVRVSAFVSGCTGYSGSDVSSLPVELVPVEVTERSAPLGEYRPYKDSMVSVPSVEKSELLKFATCLDTADAVTLNALMNSLTGGLRPCRTPVKSEISLELASVGGNEYVFLLFVPVMGRYFYTTMKKGDGRQIISDALRYGGLVKYTYMPFMVTAALRVCGIKTIKNLKSIFTVSSVLMPDHSLPMQLCLEELGAVCWHGQEGAEQASPVIRFMHCYHRIYKNAVQRIKSLGLLRAYEEASAIDEVLSYSFLHKSSDGYGCLFYMESAGRRVFPSKTNADCSQRTIWCYHADPSVPETAKVFRDLLLTLSQNRSIRKTDAVILSVGPCHVTFMVKKKQEVLLRESILNGIEEITSGNGYRYFEYRRTQVAKGQPIVPVSLSRK
ncbi:MAG: hypothetical protein IKO41_09045 [Lachnospiraceae bacterium]|nr:hypothetical protein [Lachnospiraceae bacterium]